MSFKKFCAKCGKETSALISGICAECVLKKKTLFELKIPSFGVCKHCGKFLSSGKWFLLSEQTISDGIKKKVKLDHELGKAKIFVETEQMEQLRFQTSVKVEGFLDDALVEQEKVYNFSVRPVTCDSCMKLNANYREAILQLRAEKKELAKEMFDVAITMLDNERVSDSLSGTSKIIEIPQGYDLWIGSKKAAVKIARYMAKLYNVRITSSKKIIGEEGGHCHFKFRFTYCVKRK